MTNRATDTTITLSLLKNYVTALSTTLRDENTTSIANDDNSNSAKAELLWVMEDQTALSMLASTTIDNASNCLAEYTAVTLPILAKQAIMTRYQLVCFWLPSLSAESIQPYISLIMRHRDLYAAHVIIAIKTGIDLRTYGFIPFDIMATAIHANDISSTIPVVSSPITLWQFNLYDYKRLPNWLNSDYWANPENWDKRRW